MGGGASASRSTGSVSRFRRKEAVHLQFVPEKFVEWMDNISFFCEPGVVHHSATMKKRLRKSTGKLLPISELTKSFDMWDDLHFYGLIARIDPDFGKTEVFNLETDDEEKGTLITRTKSKIGFKCDPGLFVEIGRLMKLVLLIREEERVKKGKKIKLQFDPAQRFGGQDVEDLREELAIMAELPDEAEELKTRCSELVAKLSESYVEQQTLQDRFQDTLQLSKLEHENELMEVKDDLDKKMQEQMRSVDERYMKEIEEKEKSYQKIVNKYSKLKMKYKRTKDKNKFLHSNAKLGLYNPNDPNSSPNEKYEALMTQLQEREEQILNLENEIYDLKKANKAASKAKRRASIAEGKKSSAHIDDDDDVKAMIHTLDENTDLENIKEVMRELAGARDQLQKSLKKSREKVADLEDKLSKLDQTKRKKERQHLRNNATLMRQVMTLRTALQGAGMSIPAAARSARGKTIEETLKASSNITRMMEETRKALDDGDENPRVVELQMEVKKRKAQVDWLSHHVVRMRLMGRGALRFTRGIGSKGKGEQKGRKKRPPRPQRSTTRDMISARGMKTSRHIDEINANMHKMFAQQKEEIQRLLNSVKAETKESSPDSLETVVTAPGEGEGVSSEERQKLVAANKALVKRVKSLEKAVARKGSLSAEVQSKIEGQNSELKKKLSDIQADLQASKKHSSTLSQRIQELEGMMKDKGNTDALTDQLQAKISKLLEEQKLAGEREAALKSASSQLKESKEALEKEYEKLKKSLSSLDSITEGKQALQKENEELKAKLMAVQGDMETKAEMYMKQMSDAKKEMDEMNQKLQERETKLEDELDVERKKLVRVKEEHKAQMKAFEIRRTNEIKIEMGKKMKTLEAKVLKAQEAFKEERILRIKYHNMVEDMKGKIRVYCRIRPMSKSEKKRKDEMSSKAEDKYTIVVNQKSRGREARKQFSFDEVFGPTSPQDLVYENTANLIQSAYDGYNVCIFAYGQTGTGKTYTMYGEPSNPGIAPRAIETLYACVKNGSHMYDSTITCYMVELYKSALQDLLNTSSKKTKLKITKNAQGTVEVQGCVIKAAPDAKSLMKILDDGNKKRVTSSTNMNAGSSRSHLILSIIINNVNRRTGVSTSGKLSLVDLAGCERASKTGANAQQLKEAQSINQSLSALGNVIAALSTGSKHVPYRSHVLTNLMSDSLGGNAKTLMFVNVSPSSYNTDETINALNYATRVKLVKNSASKTLETKAMREQAQMIKKLQAKLAENS
uniref:Kinesin motor domain-containing protein n=1 Tax=Lotharella globosa TaxID=91324 RepID=A0A7S3ZCK1_9EUKA|mmetsp:Transcript_22742/g.45753  ORF Transcript_22742/g.45753 Transcript_22742/m.45753 type:complete len:1250 (-) Transcript_22742:660-4409(-)